MRLRSKMLWLVALAGVAVASACSSSDEPVEAALPEWLERVYPPPNSDALPVDSIQVAYAQDRLREDDGVRLLIDATDVTTYARTEDGTLVYDPNQGPLRLDPGAHTAEVQWVRLPGIGEQHEVQDRFVWTFRFR